MNISETKFEEDLAKFSQLGPFKRLSYKNEKLVIRYSITVLFQKIAAVISRIIPFIRSIDYKTNLKHSASKFLCDNKKFLTIESSLPNINIARRLDLIKKIWKQVGLSTQDLNQFTTPSIPKSPMTEFEMIDSERTKSEIPDLQITQEHFKSLKSPRRSPLSKTNHPINLSPKLKLSPATTSPSKKSAKLFSQSAGNKKLESSRVEMVSSKIPIKIQLDSNKFRLSVNESFIEKLITPNDTSAIQEISVMDCAMIFAQLQESCNSEETLQSNEAKLLEIHTRLNSLREQNPTEVFQGEVVSGNMTEILSKLITIDQVLRFQEITKLENEEIFKWLSLSQKHYLIACYQCDSTDEVKLENLEKVALQDISKRIKSFDELTFIVSLLKHLHSIDTSDSECFRGEIVSPTTLLKIPAIYYNRYEFDPRSLLLFENILDYFFFSQLYKDSMIELNKEVKSILDATHQFSDGSSIIIENITLKDLFENEGCRKLFTDRLLKFTPLYTSTNDLIKHYQNIEKHFFGDFDLQAEVTLNHLLYIQELETARPIALFYSIYPEMAATQLQEKTLLEYSLICDHDTELQSIMKTILKASKPNSHREKMQPLVVDINGQISLKTLCSGLIDRNQYISLCNYVLDDSHVVDLLNQEQLTHLRSLFSESDLPEELSQS